MSNRALAVAFGLLLMFVLGALVTVGDTYLSDHPEALEAIKQKLQPVDAAAPDPELESIDFDHIQRIIDESDALVRLEKIANGGRTEWIESELKDRAAVCVDQVKSHYPGRSLEKITVLSLILMKGMNQNRFGNNPMTSHEMARHILSSQGEEIEIQANRAIEGR